MSESVEIASAITRFLRESSLGATQLSFTDRQVIFQPSDPAVNFYIIDSGQVRVFQLVPSDGLRLLTILGTDDCFGFSALGKLPVYDKLTMSVGNSVLRASHGSFIMQPGVDQRLIAADQRGERR